MTIGTIAKTLVELVYPRHCPSCGMSIGNTGNAGICPSCSGTIRYNLGRSCASRNFSAAWSACLYEGAVKELIHAFKYNGRMSAVPVLAGLMTDFIKRYPAVIEGVDMIASVPMRRTDKIRRGFNQAEILARNISKKFGIPYCAVLKKAAVTRHQNELSRAERLHNLAGVFSIPNPASVRAANILLIDDVMTTGATLNECAKALCDSGAKRVTCFTLAKGI